MLARGCQYFWWCQGAILCDVCSCACKVYCVGCKDPAWCQAVMAQLVGRRLEFGKVAEGALASVLGVV
eukprot:9678907-Ditylum_brightwellii.AAC.1